MLAGFVHAPKLQDSGEYTGIGAGNLQIFLFLRRLGEMPEWSIGAVSKTVVLLRAPGVRIPLSPPKTCCDFCVAGFSVLRTAAQSSVRDVRKTEKLYSAGEKSQQVFVDMLQKTEG
jgi:hypothetical protein